jgi:predicted permease
MWQDLCFSFRLLTRQPGFAFIAILAIGIGIGQATTTFNSFSALVLRPLPHMEDEDNVVYLEQVQAKAPDTRLNLSLPDFLDVRARSQTLDRPTILMSRTLIIGTGDRPIRLYGTSISAEGFAMLGVKPHRGRLFHPDEDAPGAAAVVLLSHRTWRQHYGGREDLVGKAITINGAEVTVVGIMPPGFGFPENSDAWMPFINSEKDYPRGNHSFPVYARLKPGVTLDAAQAELQVISQTLAQQYRETNDGISISVQRLRVATTADIRLLMHLTLGAVLCVLLIACANVANLLLAKAVDRHHEVAIRIALGASRGRIIRQLLTESLVLGLLGGLVGLVLAVWDNALIIGTIPVDLPYWMNFDFDWRVFAFAAAAAIISSLIFGLAPALQITRNIALELKEGGRGGVGSPRAQRLRQLLVIGQVALATLLLIGAGLMVRSYLKIQNADLGFDPRNLLTFRVGLPPTQFTDKAQVRRFFAQLTPALAAIPGVEAAGAASMLPSNGIGLNAFSIEGRPRPPTLGEHPFAVAREITPGYLQTLRIPLLRGRDISVTDTIDQPRVLLVDQAFIDRWFPGEEVLGRRLNFGDHDKPEDWATIVGVVGTVPQRLEANVPRLQCVQCRGSANELLSDLRNQGPGGSAELRHRRAARRDLRAARHSHLHGANDGEEPAHVLLAPEILRTRLRQLRSGRAVSRLVGYLRCHDVYGLPAHAGTRRAHGAGARSRRMCCAWSDVRGSGWSAPAWASAWSRHSRSRASCPAFSTGSVRRIRRPTLFFRSFSQRSGCSPAGYRHAAPPGSRRWPRCAAVDPAGSARFFLAGIVPLSGRSNLVFRAPSGTGQPSLSPISLPVS